MKLNNYNIIYLEDEAIVKETVQKMLEFKGFNVKSASNGVEALETIETGFTPHIVVTDINMPRMDGLTFVKALQKKGIKVETIVTTAHTDTDFLMDAIELKIKKFLIKPLRMDDLLESLENIIEEKELKIALLEKEKENLRLQNELIQQAKDVEIHNMFENIIHQWNQPITVIGLLASGNQYLLENNMMPDKEQLLNDLKSINETVTYMRETVDDFKDFIASSEICAEFFAKKVTQSLIKIIEARAKSFNVNFNIDIPEDLVLIGNKNHFRQILLNLLNNSIDEFERQKLPEPIINLTIKKLDDEYVLVNISDNAGGIPENLLPDRIFEHKFSTKGKKGTGIGLSICKQILENSFNGEISVKNNENGACFELKMRVKN